jgi:hypothetical protein
MRRRLAVAVVLLAGCLATASVAMAGGGIYAGPKVWYSGQSAGTSYSTTWHENFFSTYGSGFDKAVTYIDNRSYGWHNTVRNTNQTTKTLAPFQMTVKASCVAYASYFSGSCTVW